MQESAISSGVLKNLVETKLLFIPAASIIVPEEMEIGENSSIAPCTTVYATFGVTIGKNCLISSNCGISSYNHIHNYPIDLVMLMKIINIQNRCEKSVIMLWIWKK